MDYTKLTKAELITILEQKIMSSHSKVASEVRNLIPQTDKHQEHFIVIVVDSASKIVGKKVLFKGGTNVALVHPREIFKYILSFPTATGFFIAHNHPSGGNLEPSQEDITITTRIKQISEIMDIQLIDHIIVNEYSDFSFAGNNLLLPSVNNILLPSK